MRLVKSIEETDETVLAVAIFLSDFAGLPRVSGFIAGLAEEIVAIVRRKESDADPCDAS